VYLGLVFSRSCLFVCSFLIVVSILLGVIGAWRVSGFLLVDLFYDLGICLLQCWMNRCWIYVEVL